MRKRDISEQYNHVCYESKRVQSFPRGEQSTNQSLTWLFWGRLLFP